MTYFLNPTNQPMVDPKKHEYVYESICMHPYMYVGRNVVVCIFSTEQFGQSSGSFSLPRTWTRHIQPSEDLRLGESEAEKTAVHHKHRTSVYRIRILVIHFREALPSSSTWPKVASDQPEVNEMVHKCARSDSDTSAALRSLHD